MGNSVNDSNSYTSKAVRDSTGTSWVNGSGKKVTISYENDCGKRYAVVNPPRGKWPYVYLDKYHKSTFEMITHGYYAVFRYSGNKYYWYLSYKDDTGSVKVQKKPVIWELTSSSVACNGGTTRFESTYHTNPPQCMGVWEGASGNELYVRKSFWSSEKYLSWFTINLVH
eukprot:UN00310